MDERRFASSVTQNPVVVIINELPQVQSDVSMPSAGIG